VCDWRKGQRPHLYQIAAAREVAHLPGEKFQGNPTLLVLMKADLGSHQKLVFQPALAAANGEGGQITELAREREFLFADPFQAANAQFDILYAWQALDRVV